MNSIFRLIIHLKERMNRKEIVVSTIYNYLKPIKLFCEMNDIDVKWKNITLGLPKEKKYAEDRAPFYYCKEHPKVENIHREAIE